MKPIIINQGLNYPNRKVVSTIEGADFSNNAYLSNVNATGNDYFEIYLYAVGTNETITLQNLNWLGTTI